MQSTEDNAYSGSLELLGSTNVSLSLALDPSSFWYFFFFWACFFQLSLTIFFTSCSIFFLF